MVKLVIPSETYLPSYRAAFEEYRSQGINTYGMTDPDSCDIFEKYDNYRNARKLKPDRVGSDYYWLVDDERNYFIGEIAIRHRINESLALRGGHIGYVIRYGEWGRGYGTLMLRLALERAKARGLDRVLITCDDDNIASARVMERNGCILEDIIEVNGVQNRRYWKTL